MQQQKQKWTNQEHERVEEVEHDVEHAVRVVLVGEVGPLQSRAAQNRRGIRSGFKAVLTSQASAPVRARASPPT